MAISNVSELTNTALLSAVSVPVTDELYNYMLDVLPCCLSSNSFTFREGGDQLFFESHPNGKKTVSLIYKVMASHDFKFIFSVGLKKTGNDLCFVIKQEISKPEYFEKSLEGFAFSCAGDLVSFIKSPLL